MDQVGARTTARPHPHRQRLSFVNRNHDGDADEYPSFGPYSEFEQDFVRISHDRCNMKLKLSDLAISTAQGRVG